MIEAFLIRAQRRLVINHVSSNLSQAVASLFIALSLLLLLGNRIFDWRIVAGLAAASLALALFLVFHRVPGLTQVARLLDSRCQLADALATARYFEHSSSEIACVQRRQAEAAASRVDLAATLPFTPSRSLYLAAGAFALALFLAIFRYGFERHLDLNLPVSFLHLDSLTLAAQAGAQSEERTAKKNKTNPSSPDRLAQLGTSTPDNPDAQDIGGSRESSLAGGGKDPGQLGKPENGGSQSAQGNNTSGEQSSADSPGQGESSQKPAGDQSPSGQDGEQQGAQQTSKSPGRAEGSGLLSKLKEAVSSLMAKMKPSNGQSQPQNGQQQNQQAKSNSSGGKQSGQSQQGQKGETGQPQQGEESAAAESDQSSPDKGSGKSNDQNASAKPGSGMGHQDGAKDLKDAEQLAAMGKLSEIIGKRSATVSGEMTIDQQGPQQLRTRYVNNSARHGEASGNISRDEVPVALQSYVQEYFEQVRKQAAVKTPRIEKTKAHE